MPPGRIKIVFYVVSVGVCDVEVFAHIYF